MEPREMTQEQLAETILVWEEELNTLYRLTKHANDQLHRLKIYRFYYCEKHPKNQLNFGNQWICGICQPDYWKGYS